MRSAQHNTHPHQHTCKPRMPTASAALRGSSYATTYGTSYTTSPIGRSSSASRRTGSLANGYSSGYSSPSSITPQYRSSRPGPSSFDRPARKADTFSISGLDSTRRTRASPVGLTSKPGPLRADHNTGLYGQSGARYGGTDLPSDHLIGSSILNRRSSRSGLDPLPSTLTSTSRLSGRRSASLANLHIDDEPSSSIYSRSHYDSEERIGQRTGSGRRGSRLDDDILKPSPRARQTGVEEKKESGRSRYTPSVSRESSPSTSNGIGSRGRHFGEPSEELPSSHFSTSQSSSSSASTNVCTVIFIVIFCVYSF